jgi:hypothetical protein
MHYIDFNFNLTKKQFEKFKEEYEKASKDSPDKKVKILFTHRTNKGVYGYEIFADINENNE